MPLHLLFGCVTTATCQDVDETKLPVCKQILRINVDNCLLFRYVKDFYTPKWNLLLNFFENNITILLITRERKLCMHSLWENDIIDMIAIHIYYIIQMVWLLPLCSIDCRQIPIWGNWFLGKYVSKSVCKWYQWQVHILLCHFCDYNGDNTHCWNKVIEWLYYPPGESYN